jgi:hypothetical protein
MSRHSHMVITDRQLIHNDHESLGQSTMIYNSKSCHISLSGIAKSFWWKNRGPLLQVCYLACDGGLRIIPNCCCELRDDGNTIPSDIPGWCFHNVRAGCGCRCDNSSSFLTTLHTDPDICVRGGSSGSEQVRWRQSKLSF